MMHRKLRAGLFVGSTLSLACLVWADADSAKKYLQQAQADVADNKTDSANTDLQLAETELDGVDDAVKAPILKDIQALKTTLSDAKNAGAKQDIQREIDRQMAEAKTTLDSKQSFDEEDKAIRDYLAKDEVKAALGDDAVAKYLKTLTTFGKVAAANGFARNLDQAKGLLDSAEQEWPEKLKSMQESNAPVDEQPDATSFSHDLDRIEGLVKDFPADKPEAAVQIARFKKLQNAFNAQVAQSKAGEILETMKRGWDSYADDRAGWEKEDTGPTFDEMLHNQGDVMSALKAPKTVALISRANSWFDDQMKDENARTLADTDPKIKAYIKEMIATRQAAWDKMEKFAGAVLDQAEKTEINKEARDRLETLANDDFRLDLEGSPHLKALQLRALKLVGKFDQKAVGDAAAQEKLYGSLVDQGNKAWPAMVQKMNAADGIDAVAASAKIDDFKGKTIRLKGVKNRMGWDYNPSGGCEFAVTIDTVPVAGKFSPALRKAFNGLLARTGKDFSDEEYDVVGEIQGVGPIVKIARSEGTLQTDSGEKVANITTQHDETVQGIRLNIIGLHVGPVTAVEGQGVVDENGTIVP